MNFERLFVPIYEIVKPIHNTLFFVQIAPEKSYFLNIFFQFNLTGDLWVMLEI